MLLQRKLCFTKLVCFQECFVCFASEGAVRRVEQFKKTLFEEDAKEEAAVR